MEGRSNAGSDAKPKKNRSWEESFQALLQHKQANGGKIRLNCNRNLKSWINYQRYNHENLTVEQCAKLKSIGISFPSTKSYENTWQEKYNRLKLFYQTHGHSNCPTRYEDDLELGRWTTTQRSRYKQNRLSQDRIEKLEAIGFSWKLRGTKLEPNTNLPNADTQPENNVETVDGSFTTMVSPSTNAETEPSEKATERRTLSGASSCKHHDEKWLVQYNKLKDYKKLHGNCRVPQGYHSDRSLGSWVATQRDYYARNKLDPERKRLLDEIGFTWRIRNGCGKHKKKKKAKEEKESYLVGRKIRVKFDIGWFNAEVTRKGPGDSWHVEYSDGEGEDIAEAELDELRANYERHYAGTNFDGWSNTGIVPACCEQLQVGTKIRKEFNWGWYDGVVTQAKGEGVGRWMVEYRDGGEEYVSDEELEDLATNYQEYYSENSAVTSDLDFPFRGYESDDVDANSFADSEVSPSFNIQRAKPKKRRNRLYDHGGSSKYRKIHLEQDA